MGITEIFDHAVRYLQPSRKPLDVVLIGRSSDHEHAITAAFAGCDISAAFTRFAALGAATSALSAVAVNPTSDVPDVVILDAERGALDFVRFIAGDRRLKRLPIIVHAPSTEREAYLAAGAVACLPPPTTLAAVEAYHAAVRGLVCSQ
jgi:hypothetical protein